jgi:hypothetical protein
MDLTTPMRLGEDIWLLEGIRGGSYFYPELYWEEREVLSYSDSFYFPRRCLVN